MKEWAVFHFEYDLVSNIGEHIPWKCYIAAANHEEAKVQLVKTVGRDIKISITGKTCRLDAISENLRNTILEAGKPKVKRGRPPGTKKKIPDDVKV